MYPSIRFELDFYRILSRVFCFGEILPTVRNFYSLPLVIWYVPLFSAPRSWRVDGWQNKNKNWHIHMEATIKWRAEMNREVLIHSPLYISPVWKQLPQEYAVYHWLVFKLCGIAFACLPHVVLLHSYHCMLREINILSLMGCLGVFFPLMNACTSVFLVKILHYLFLHYFYKQAQC